MSPDTYLAYLGVLAVFFAGPPGPSQLLMISNALSHGLGPSLATMAGDLTANALQMTAAAFGLAALIAGSADGLAAVKWAGVAYLLWLGVQKWRAAPARLGQAARRPPGRTALYRQGLLTSAANPKAVVFFAALFPQFIDPALPVWPQLLILGGTYLLVDGALLIGWSLLAIGSAARLRALTGRAVARISGAMLIGAAGLLALKDIAREGGR